MHDLVRDMGRYIVQGTSLKNCERWSRLWDRDHVIDVLANYSVRNKIPIHSLSQPKLIRET